MPRISIEKENKIKEAILHLLYEKSPSFLYTYHVAKELARDEEYIKKLMEDLERQNFVISKRKNEFGKEYSRRIGWQLSSKTYEAYKKLNNQENLIK